METTLYKISFEDGRKFNVFCANKAQKVRFNKTIPIITLNGGSITKTLNGIHTVAQWIEWIEYINNSK